MGPTGPPENKSAQLETRPRPAADNWPRENKSARPDTRPRHTGELGPGKQISTAGHTTATYWENWAPGTHVFTAGRETAPCWRAAGPAKNTAGDWTATCLKQLAPGGEKNSRRQDGDVLGGGRLGPGEPNQHSQGRRRRDLPGGWQLGPGETNQQGWRQDDGMLGATSRGGANERNQTTRPQSADGNESEKTDRRSREQDRDLAGATAPQNKRTPTRQDRNLLTAAPGKQSTQSESRP